MQHKSKKKFTALISLSLCLICFFSSLLFFGCKKETESTAELIKRIKPSVCVTMSDNLFGTGFVIKRDGSSVYILTNKHTINFESETSVYFEDGRVFLATVLGYNTYHDLAVLKIEAQSTDVFTPLIFKNEVSDEGESVFLIGNALNNGLSVFDGIVSVSQSTLLYESASLTKRVPIVGVTADINEGSSGAPIFDLTGEVIGVATYKTTLSATTPIGSMNYCVPSLIAKSVSEQIIKENAYASKTASESLDFDIRLAKSLKDREPIINFEALGFSAQCLNGELTILEVFSSELNLSAGDKIIGVGDINLKNKGIVEIFAVFLRFIDERSVDSDAIKSDKPLTIKIEKDGTEKEITFLRKYEKNY